LQSNESMGLCRVVFNHVPGMHVVTAITGLSVSIMEVE